MNNHLAIYSRMNNHLAIYKRGADAYDISNSERRIAAVRASHTGWIVRFEPAQPDAGVTPEFLTAKEAISFVILQRLD